MRIAHLTTADISLALLLSTELSERVDEGHTVFGVSAPGRYVERIEALGVTHVPVMALSRSWGLAQDVRAFIELSRTIRSLDLDVLHTHNPKTGVMGRIAGRLAGVPVVVNTCHGLWATPEDSLAKRAFVYGLEGLAARFSDFELFQNAQDERTLRRFLKPGRRKVVGNGIDLERFRFDAEGRDRLRTQWGVRDDEILVGTVGRRVREKGLAEYASVAKDLAGRARFVWVGPEDETDTSATTGVDLAGVDFVSEQTDMPAVYSAFDVFVLASYREGFSRASMEAAACGRPMILSDIRGCREIGDHETHLLLTEPRSADALRSTIDQLLADSSLRERLGLAAEIRARREFDQRTVARRSTEAYDDVARWKRLNHLRTTTRQLVLHVLPDDRRRGAQAYAGRLRDALASSPRQQHLAVTLFGGPQGALRPDVRLGVKPGLWRRAIDPRAMWRLRRLVKRTRPDVVVAHGGEPLKYVVPATAGVAKTAYYKVGLSSAELARPSRLRLFRALARRVDVAVAVSNDIAAQLNAVLRVPPDRIRVIPNGRDPESYHPPDEEEAPQQDAAQILFIGELEVGKRPELFLDVVAALRRRRVSASAAVVGQGSLGSSLRSRAHDLGVAMLGSRDDVPSLLRHAEVLVITSAPDTEGMPGVAIEAGLSAIPVVSTAAAGVADVIEHGVTGYVVKRDDSERIAESVFELLADPVQRRTMGIAAQARCIEQFTMQSSAVRWESEISDLTAPREKRIGRQQEHVASRSGSRS